MTAKPTIGDLVIGCIALSTRVATLIWARGRFSPAADGYYYHAIASRLADGLGSTWLWPDGSVTYAAHYPIGYPAMLAASYRLLGSTPTAGGLVNALVGSMAAVAVRRLVLQDTGPAPALAAGLAVAFHPALVMYTPALMTEGVVAALVATGAWVASHRSRWGAIAVGIVMGIATLVRPQSLLLAPCFGLVCARAGANAMKRLRRAALATLVALLVCAPWTARNCLRMHKCALVSFNGGWNLLIGAAENATGSWAPVEVPPACRTVWDEAEKDACFRRQAIAMIAKAPGRWVSLVPARLAATFDYAGAPGFYLHESNAEAFDDRDKRVLGVVETVYERLAYLGALAAASLAAGPRRRARVAVAGVAALFLFHTHAYLAVLGLAATLALRGKSLLEGPALTSTTFFALAATAAVHAVFFGSGRYSMVVFPLLTGLVFLFERRSVTWPPWRALPAPP